MAFGENFLRDKVGSPERVRWLYLAQSGMSRSTADGTGLLPIAGHNLHTSTRPPCCFNI